MNDAFAVAINNAAKHSNVSSYAFDIYARAKQIFADDSRIPDLRPLINFENMRPVDMISHIIQLNDLVKLHDEEL
jgi:hypothetical protein